MSFQDYVGRTETRTDVVAPHLLHGLAATLGRQTPERLPALWHWTLFQDWVPQGQLGSDGHPKRGGFLPPVQNLPQRMWAAGCASWRHCTRRCGAPHQHHFRGLRPAFHDNAPAIEAWPDGDVWRLRTLDASGQACMSAETTLA